MLDFADDLDAKDAGLCRICILPETCELRTGTYKEVCLFQLPFLTCSLTPSHQQHTMHGH